MHNVNIKVLKENFDTYVAFDKMLVEVGGYTSHSKLIEDVILEKITEDKFNVILNEYIEEALIQNIGASVVNIILPLIRNAMNWITSSLNKVIAILIKIIDAILKFKEKHPKIVNVTLMVVFSFVLSALTHHAMHHPPEDAPEVFETVLSKLVSATTNNAELLHQIQLIDSEISKARGNVQQLIQFVQGGGLKPVYQVLTNLFTNLQKTIDPTYYKNYLANLVTFGLRGLQIA